jgi:hypothetical protein
MTTTTNYTWLTSINVQFKLPPGLQRCRHGPQRHLFLMTCVPLDDLFTTNRADVIRNVLSIIRTQVVETLVIPLATQTARDPLLILPCLQPATFNIYQAQWPTPWQKCPRCCYKLCRRALIVATSRTRLSRGWAIVPGKC